MENILSFMREARAELKKVTWPGKRQLGYSTVIVIVFSLLVASYLGLVDMMLTWIFSKILG